MELIDKKLLDELSEFYKLFSDTTRLRILNCLLNGELNVSEISSLLQLSQSLVSHQLKNLRYSNFVKARREGKTIYYSILDNHIEIILKYGLEHIMEKKYEKD